MAHQNTFEVSASLEQKFVISACSFTYQGYSLFLKEQGITASQIRFNGETIAQGDIKNIVINQYAEISVFLDNDVVNLLDTLKKLATLLNVLPVIRTVTLYGQIPDSWLYRTLENMVDNKNTLSRVRVATLVDVINCVKTSDGLRQARSQLLSKKSFYCEYKGTMKGLTRRELDVLLNFYRGISIKVQCESLGLSNKTLYTHRKEGVKKLHLIKPWLSDRNLFRMEESNHKDMQEEGLSSREVEIFNALLRREIFPVYQIITDRFKKGVGFEILLRWNNNGKVLKPTEFMTDISSVEIWLKITALVIHAAISGINKYNGKFYFSVNIPPQLASGNALPGMAKKATGMLLQPQWASKLVFEFAETIDVTKDKAIPETMQRLRNTGCRLFLDDCFSDHHVMFPVRQVHFDGLKLDRDIVEQFVANDNDYNLIKTIQFYSDITGSECVAEGVDSEEKFEKLAALGIKSFQGYYLSRAVKEDELDRMVRLFS